MNHGDSDIGERFRKAGFQIAGITEQSVGKMPMTVAGSTLHGLLAHQLKRLPTAPAALDMVAHAFAQDDADQLRFLLWLIELEQVDQTRRGGQADRGRQSGLGATYASLDRDGSGALDLGDTIHPGALTFSGLQAPAWKAGRLWGDCASSLFF